MMPHPEYTCMLAAVVLVWITENPYAAYSFSHSSSHILTLRVSFLVHSWTYHLHLVLISLSSLLLAHVFSNPSYLLFATKKHSIKCLFHLVRHAFSIERKSFKSQYTLHFKFYRIFVQYFVHEEECLFSLCSTKTTNPSQIIETLKVKATSIVWIFFCGRCIFYFFLINTKNEIMIKNST